MLNLTREHFNTHVNPKLRRNILIYLSISGLIFLVILYRIISAGNSFHYPLLAFAVGLIVGMVVSRMYVISWDKDADRVVSRMDIYGVIFLAAYILFEISSEHFIKQWFRGPLVLTVILSLVGGTLLGRGFGMIKKIVRLLKINIY